MIPPKSPTDWDVAMVLPLGVLANQLIKIEGDLRFLSMKAAEHSSDEGARPTRAVEVRIDLIRDTLDSIKMLLVKLQHDIHPKRASTQVLPRESANSSTHKPLPERDD